MTHVFFTDRDLGKQFPAILRTAGILVEAHGDKVVAFLAKHLPPFIAKVYQGPPDRGQGEFKAGRVELWLDKTGWRRR